MSKSSTGSQHIPSATQISKLQQELTACQAKLAGRNPMISSLVQHSPMATAVFDTNMCYIAANNAWTDSYNLDDQDIVGKLDYDVLPDISDAWKNVHARCLQGAHESCSEDPLPTADGNLVWLNWSVYPWLDLTGQIAGIVMTTEVVSEQIQAREEARVFRKLVESSSEGIVISDLNSTITYTNSAYQDMVSATGDSLVGQSLMRYVGSGYDLDDVNDTTRKQGEWHGIINHKQASGNSFLAKVVSFAMRDSTGALTQRASICRDVTDEQRLRRSLVDNEQRLQMLLTSLPVMIFTTDLAGIITLSEGRELKHIGLEPGQAVGQSVFTFYQDMPEITANVERALNGESLSFEIYYPTSQQYFERYFTPLKDTSGVTTGMIGLAVNITDRKYSEADSVAWRERYDLIVASSGQLVYESDLASGDRKWRGGAREVLGLNLAELQKGMDFWANLIHPDDRTVTLKALKQAEAKRTPYSLEYRFQNVAGDYITVLDRGLVKANATGKAVTMLGMMQDISERKGAEQALRLSEKRLHVILTSLPIIVFSINSEGLFTMFEGKALSTLGLKPNQVIGLSAFEFYSENQDIVSHIRQALAGETAVSEAYISGRHFENYFVPLATPDGLSALGVAYDITEFKRTEAALRESQQFLEDAQSISKLGGWSFDLASQRISWSKQVYDTMEASYDSVIDNDFLMSFYSAAAAATLQAAITRAIEYGEAYNLELEITTLKGNRRWVRVIGKPVIEAGKVIRLTGTQQDITDITQTRRELEQSIDNLANLNTLSTNLNRVETISQMLEAILEPFSGYSSASILYAHYEDAHLTALECATSRTLKGPAVFTKGQYYPLDTFPEHERWLSTGKSTLMIDNVSEDSYLNDEARASYLRTNVAALALIALHQADRVLGVIGIYWDIHHTFSNNERSYLEALAPLVVPVTATLQALSNLATSNKRLSSLNEVSTQLNQVQSIDELLEVIIAPLNFTEGGLVASVNYPQYDDQHDISGVQLVSTYAPGTATMSLEVGTVFSLEQFSSFDLASKSYQQTFITDDIATDDHFNHDSRSLLHHLGIGSQVVLVLRQGETLVALIGIYWSVARGFSADERAYLEALPTLLTPVVANLHSLAELSRANERLARINRVSNALKVAETIDSILETILEPLSRDAAASMSRPIYDDTGNVIALKIIGNRSLGSRRLDVEVGAIFQVEDYSTINWYLEDSDRVKLISDVTQDPRFDANLRTVQAQLGIGAQAYITLRQATNILAFVSVTWAEVHTFTDDEQAYFDALPSLLLPVVANRHALENLEQSNNRLAILNHLGSELKAAETAEKMLQVLLEPLGEDALASLFYAITNDEGEITALKLSVEYPHTGSLLDVGTLIDVAAHPGSIFFLDNPNAVTIIEEVDSNPYLDDYSKTTLASLGVVTTVFVPLRQVNKWIGVLSVSYFNKHTFSTTERGYLEALSSLLAPSIANLRMVENLEETVAMRSEELARSRQLLRATIDNAPLIISVKDTNFRYILANTNISMLVEGATPQGIIGQDDFDLLPLHIAEDIRKTDTYVLHNKVPHYYEALRTNGIIYYVSKFPLFDSNGDVFAVGLIANDITEQRHKDQEMQAYRDQLAHAEAELQVTQRIQELLLPSDDELAAISELDIASYMKPAEQVGGDYYDIMQLGDTVRFGIGDVTGHGLESGLLMLMTQTAIRTLFSNEEHDPKRIMSVLNQTVFDNLQRMQVDKSLTLSLLDYEHGQLRLSGQHEYVLVMRKGGRVDAIDTIDLGMPLGLEADISQFIAEQKLHLNPGEGVVLFTDGITEAENDNHEQFGLTRFTNLLTKHWQQPAQVITDAIIQAVDKHVGQHVVYDDITLVVFKRPMEDITIV